MINRFANDFRTSVGRLTRKTLTSTVASVCLGLTLLCSAPYPAEASSLYFTETFYGPTLGPNLQDADSAWTLENGSVHRTSYVDSSDRHYIRTVSSDYMNHDFVAEVTMTLRSPPEGGGAINFFGIGSGSGDPTFYNEVTDSLLFRIHTIQMCCGASGRVDGVALPGPFQFIGGADFYRISTEGGTHRFQITKQGDSVTFAVDENYSGGAFLADGSFTLHDARTWAPWLGENNAHIFFGTHSSFDTFDDFSVRSLEAEPVPEPSSLLLVGSGILAGLSLRRRGKS